MPADAPTPLPLRPSEGDRARVAQALRAGSVEGKLSIDTFSERIDRLLAARSQSELDSLVADVRGPDPIRSALLRGVAWWASLAADVRAAWHRPHEPVLGLPAADVSVTLGRSRDCDCILAEPSVSRRHAQLRRGGGRWFLRDLGSRNGTRVNGVRLLDEAEVCPGDRVSFGDASFRLGEPPRGEAV
ncbi:MAG TPA: DUF1707 and FHA domain-containing protein [Thermoleophilaceae bacterium]|nr:DUF1707 and FHA domain-containing protein [Thermoleophilaceae bacterium]